MLRSHRARLTAVAGGATGLLLFVIFAIFSAFLRSGELSAARRELTPALNQVTQDIEAGNGNGDLAEVVSSDPEISLAVFDSSSKMLAADGKQPVSFSKTEGVIGKQFLLQARANDKTIVAGVNWEPHERLIQQFTLACALLWFPVVGMVGLATWLTARSTFLPLQRLAQDAEAMSVENLSSRLQPEDSGEYRDFVLRLNRFLARLEDSVRREERFLSDAAHELRTPLTILRGQIETTLQRDRTGPEYRKTLGVLLDETARLSSLAELLLRSATSTNPAGPIDLSGAAERAHARWVDRFAAKGAKLELNVTGVQAAITEPEADVILDNLLANGLRVSGPGADCQIDVHATEDMATLRVIDNGPGISADEAERVFDRFVSGSSASGGFGIGLAVCKRILAARGGQISIEPNQSHGCIFSVRIPRSEIPLRMAPPEVKAR